MSIAAWVAIATVAFLLLVPLKVFLLKKLLSSSPPPTKEDS